MKSNCSSKHFISSTPKQDEIAKQSKGNQTHGNKKNWQWLFDLLNRTSHLNMLSVKVIKQPFYHSCPLGSLVAGCILLT
jgi:hypothetical protein